MRNGSNNNINKEWKAFVFGWKEFVLVILIIALIAGVITGAVYSYKKHHGLDFTSSSAGPSGKIKGLWTNNLGCGQPLNGESTFNLIALSSALPQNYSLPNYNNFFST